MNDLRTRLLAAFRAEHREYLDGLRGLIADIERAGGSAAPEALEELFRLAHSLKAAARACDLPALESIGQRLEAIFGRLRNGALKSGPELFGPVRGLLNALEDAGMAVADGRDPQVPKAPLDAIDRLLSNPAARAPASAGPSDLNRKLMAAFQVELQEHLEGIRTILASLGKGDLLSPADVDEAFRRAHTLKGASRTAGMTAADYSATDTICRTARIIPRTSGLSSSSEVRCSLFRPRPTKVLR